MHTSPAFDALLAAYTAKAKLVPDTEARAVLMLLAVYAGRVKPVVERPRSYPFSRLCCVAPL